MNSTPAAQHSPKRRHSRWLLPLLGLLLTSLAVWQIAIFTGQYVQAEILRTGQPRVTLYAGSLRESLEKYRHLPYLLARDLRIRKLLEENLPAIRVNPHLEDFARVSGALLFVLDHQGDTVAASNWREEQSLIGSNFAFRPYFQDAREGRSGSYYAVGGITGQLKTFARKNPGRRDPQDLAAVLERVLSCLTPQVEKSGVEVQLSLPPPGSAVIEGDDLQVEQVLNNLLLNALDAMADSPVPLLRLGMTTTDRQAILVCHDSGPGISDEALESLFEPFATTKPIGFGLGLGLSISYGIVQEMSGALSGENHPEGGAVFTLRLPLAAYPPDQPTRSIAP